MLQHYARALKREPIAKNIVKILDSVRQLINDGAEEPQERDQREGDVTALPSQRESNKHREIAHDEALKWMGCRKCTKRIREARGEGAIPIVRLHDERQSNVKCEHDVQEQWGR